MILIFFFYYYLHTDMLTHTLKTKFLLTINVINVLASDGAFCGNKIVEAGEECDCGFNDDECKDHCCYPRVVSELDRLKNSTARGCYRRYNTECSPSQG
jgi:hypothetical protein